MKGLILKDYYFIFRQHKILFRLSVLITVVGSICTLRNEHGHNACVFGSLAMTIFSLSSLQDDEISRWNVCCDTFPVSRKTFVSEKYLFTIGNMVGIWLASSVLMCLSNIIWQVNTSEIIRLAFHHLETILLGILFIVCLMFPLTFKIGYRKARIVNLVFVAVYITLIAVIANTDNTTHFSENIPVVEIWSGIIIVFCVFSWWLSVRIYSKKEL